MKSPKTALHGAVCVPSRAVQLFAALLVLMRTSSYGDFPNSFTMKARAGPYRPYDTLNSYYLLNLTYGM